MLRKNRQKFGPNSSALTEPDKKVLNYAIKMKDQWGLVGVFPRRGRQYQQFRKLADWGLLKYVGLGYEVAAEPFGVAEPSRIPGTIRENKLQIYELTEQGEKVARELEKE